jgi:hypothetical protein
MPSYESPPPDAVPWLESAGALVLAAELGDSSLFFLAHPDNGSTDTAKANTKNRLMDLFLPIKGSATPAHALAGLKGGFIDDLPPPEIALIIPGTHRRIQS